MILGVFEFRIRFCKIFVPGLEFSENTRFVCLLMSLPGAFFVKKHELSFLPTISDVQTTLKREDVSMRIQKISPGQELETQLQKNKLSKLFKSVQYALSVQWAPSITTDPFKITRGS